MKRDDDSGTRQRAETEIFNLRKQAEMYLQVGDIDEFNKINITIVTLQETHGIFSGKGKAK